MKVVQSYGIPTDFIRITENCSSGVAQICVAENGKLRFIKGKCLMGWVILREGFYLAFCVFLGENHIVIVPGANDTVTKDDLKEPLEAIKNCKVLICQLEITLETTLEALRIKKDSGIGMQLFPVNSRKAETGFALPRKFLILNKFPILMLLHAVKCPFLEGYVPPLSSRSGYGAGVLKIKPLYPRLEKILNNNSSFKFRNFSKFFYKFFLNFF